jgi:hypothetical protein
MDLLRRRSALISCRLDQANAICALTSLTANCHPDIMPLYREKHLQEISQQFRIYG